MVFISPDYLPSVTKEQALLAGGRNSMSISDSSSSSRHCCPFFLRSLMWFSSSAYLAVCAQNLNSIMILSSLIPDVLGMLSCDTCECLHMRSVALIQERGSLIIMKKCCCTTSWHETMNFTEDSMRKTLKIYLTARKLPSKMGLWLLLLTIILIIQWSLSRIVLLALERARCAEHNPVSARLYSSANRQNTCSNSRPKACKATTACPPLQCACSACSCVMAAALQILVQLSRWGSSLWLTTSLYNIEPTQY